MEIWHQQPSGKKADLRPRHTLNLKNLFRPSPEETDMSASSECRYAKAAVIKLVLG